jgi:hypothetical protein
LNLDNNEDLKVFNNIRFSITNDKTNKVLFKFNPKKIKNSNSYTIEDNGKFRICVFRPRLKGINTVKVMLKMKVITENTEGKNLDKALKDKDLNPISDKINHIIDKSNQIIISQKKETDIEDAFSNMQISYTWNFVLFAVLQVIGVLIIGVYHIYSFRRFLISNNMMD